MYTYFTQNLYVNKIFNIFLFLYNVCLLSTEKGHALVSILFKLFFHFSLFIVLIFWHEKFSDLLKDIKRLSELNGLTEPIFSNTRTLKRRIIDKFSDDISFYINDKYLIVHSSNAKPCEYVLAILKGKELKDYDVIKSFWEMTWMKIKITSK